MIRALLLFVLAAVATGLPTDVSPLEQVIRLGNAGVKYVNLKGVLIPTADPTTNIPTFVFRTSVGGPAANEDLLGFRCSPLNDIYVTDHETSRAALICSGDVNEKKMVFLFAAEGLKFAPHEKVVNLMLEREVVGNLDFVPQAILRIGMPGERFKRQFGLGFSGSGAQAGSSSFGGGGGFGGFPGGGFGGGFSGSQASAGSSSFGGGGGFFG